MSFKNKLSLVLIKEGVGAGTPMEESSTDVWADVTEVGFTTKMAAVSAGYKAEYQAVMYRNEYSGQNYVRWAGEMFRITSTGRAKNDRHIKLIFARQG